MGGVQMIPSLSYPDHINSRRYKKETTMTISITVESIARSFLTPSLPKHPVKLEYTAIKNTHQILTVNAASVKSDLGGGHNGYLGLILPPA